MLSTLQRIALLVALTLCSGCGLLSSDRLIEVERPEQTTASGVQIHDLTLGNGEAAQAGDWLKMDYVALLTDRTELDSTYDRGQPVEFQLGKAPVAGWNEGVSGMRIGGRRTLVIPAHLAFGQEGVPGRVPPGATLIYEMELVALRREQAPDA